MPNRVSEFRAAAAAGLVALAGFSGAALGQQPAAKGAPPAKAAPAAQPQSAWVKLCEPTQQHKLGPDGRPQLDKDNKPVLESKLLCMTHHEQMNEVGVSQVSVLIQQLEGVDRQHVMIVVPPAIGIVMPAGINVFTYTKEQLEKIERKEKVEQGALVGQRLVFTTCHANGCTAENEATPQLIDAMKNGAAMVAFVTQANGQPLPIQIPLTGFAATFAGKPVDAKVFSEQRQRLNAQFAEKRVKALEEMQAEMRQGGQAPAPKAPAK